MTDRTPLVFLDTETLGLDPSAPTWEFAAVRRDPEAGETRCQFLIRHTDVDRDRWLPGLPENFRRDYMGRYRDADAIDEDDAAERIAQITAGAMVAGSNPAFDLDRLSDMLIRNGMVSSWHYRVVDLPVMVAGYLAGKGTPVNLPWYSENLSRSIGVDPADFDRHTAMGDVEWTIAMWDAMSRGDHE